MAWNTPKENWVTGDGVSYVDMNRIESNIAYLKNSPDLNAPTVTTQAYGDSSTKAANTAFATGQDLGVGQTWQDVTGSRAIAQTYTNTTGKPIEVAAYIKITSAATIPQLLVNSIEVKQASSTMWAAESYITLSAIVPTGATYQVKISAGSIILFKWTELR